MRELQIVFIIACVFIIRGNVKVTAFPADVDNHPCGLAVGKRIPRIINGSVAEVGQIPWIVSIKKGGRHMCGGTIIFNQFVLSAGHCFSSIFTEYGHIVDSSNARDHQLDRWEVTLGEYNQVVPESHSVTLGIKRIIFHNEYQRSPVLQNDIVLLELNDTITWTDHIQPICLPSEDVKASASAWAAGWGRDRLFDTVQTKEDRDKLRFIQVPIYENEKCQQFYDSRSLRIRIANTEMCAGTVDEIHDTSEGDSGGPLYIRVGGRAILVGITSKGTTESSFPKMPAIYTRVFKFLEWIHKYSR